MGLVDVAGYPGAEIVVVFFFFFFFRNPLKFEEDRWLLFSFFLSAVFIMHHQTSKRPIFLRHTITTRVHDRMHTPLLLFSTTLIIFPPSYFLFEHIPRIPALCNCITSILRNSLPLEPPLAIVFSISLSSLFLVAQVVRSLY